MGNRNPEIASFHLTLYVYANTQTHKTHLTYSYYHLVTADPPFIRKTIECMHQTKPRKVA